MSCDEVNEAASSDKKAEGGIRAKEWIGIVAFALVAVLAAELGSHTRLGACLSANGIAHIAGHLGIFGPALIILIGVLTPPLFLPRWPIAFASGLLYGVVWGTMLATFASTLGAWFHFHLAKGLLSRPAERVMAGFKLSRGAIAPDKMALGLFLLRAFPLSNFCATNLLAGALRMRTWVYVAVSFVGMLPSSLMYASWGKLMKKPESSYYWVAAFTLLFIVAGGVAVRRRFLPRLGLKTAWDPSESR